MTERTLSQWKVGDFAMNRSSPVRLQEEIRPDRFSVELVSNYENGAGVCCGGYVSSYGSHELKPVTDVETLILCAAYAAMKAIEAAKVEITRQEAIFAANKAALSAFRKARDTAAAMNASAGGSDHD